MGLFDKLKGTDINGFATEAMAQGIKLIDVREPKEFERGRIPGAVNIPLNSLAGIADVVPEKDTVLYVYCLSGGRSSRACKQLKSMGYANAVNIGGINSYRGPVER